MITVRLTRRGDATWTHDGVQYMANPETKQVWVGSGWPTPETVAEQTAWFAENGLRLLGEDADRKATERAEAEKAEAQKDKAEAEKAAKIAELKAIKNPSFAQRAELLSLQIQWMFVGSPDEYRRQSAVVQRLKTAAEAQFTGRLFFDRVLVIGLRDTAVMEDYASQHGANSNRALLLLNGRACSITKKVDRRGKTILVVNLSACGHTLRVSEERFEGGFTVVTSNAGNSRIYVG